MNAVARAEMAGLDGDDAHPPAANGRKERLSVPVDPDPVGRERARLRFGRDRGRDRSGVTAPTTTRAEDRDSDTHRNAERDATEPQPSLPPVYLISVRSLNIGRYMEITIVPTMAPTPIIRIGSMIEVSDWMLASTSSS
jgi:hypothetical protein